MKRLLFVAYHVPPQIGIASARAASFLRWLPSLGWSVTLIHPRNPFHPLGPGPHTGTAEAFDPMPTHSPEIAALARRVRPGEDPQGAGPLSVGTSVGVGWARRLVHTWVYVPDSRVGWIPFAAAALRRALHRSDASATVVLSTSVPYSAHLAALAGVSGTRVRWVAEFRDPWSEADSFLRPASSARRGLDERMHRLIVDRADRTVVTSEDTRARLIDRLEVDGDRVAVVPNGFEPSRPGYPPGPEGPCRLLYAGTVARGEDVRPLLQGLRAARTVSGIDVRLQVIGPREPWLSVARELEPLAEALELLGPRDPEGARESMHAASANVLINQHAAYASILPGKVFEYLGARRPILAAVREGTELDRLLREYGQPVWVRRPVAAVWTEALVRIAREHASGTLQHECRSTRPLTDLTREARARDLARVLDSVVAS